MNRIDARLIKTFPSPRTAEKFKLDLHLESKSEAIALLGPSGSGKTLTLNCIAGFVRPDEGRILVNDELFFDSGGKVSRAPRYRRCGYISQEHALFPHMTVRENLFFAASSRPQKGWRKGGGLHRRRVVADILDSFELAPLADRTPAELSGGQKQRAALGRILVSEPQLLLLDEPTRGLDARLRENFYRLLEQMKEQFQVPVLLVTHDVNECLRLSKYVCFMEGGKILQAGPCEEVLGMPGSLSMVRSLGVYSWMPGEILSLDPSRNISKISAFGEVVEARYLPGHLIGDRGYLCLRNAELSLADEGSRSVNCFSLPVVRAVPAADGIRVELEGQLSLTISQREWNSLGRPDRLTIQIPPASAHFLG